MPNRIIRETILTSRAVNQLSDAEEIFYRRLMSIADDFGRFDADPEVLLVKLYPYQLDRHTTVTCAKVLSRVSHVTATHGQPLVTVYEVDGRKYLQINNFKQRSRAKTSKWPSPDGQTAVMRRSGAHVDGDVDGDGDGDVIVGVGNATDAVEPRDEPVADDVQRILAGKGIDTGRTPKRKANPWQDEQELDYMRNSLQQFVRLCGLNWGKPDLDLTAQVLRAGGGMTAQQIHAELELRRREGKQPAKSWGWFPALVKSFAGGAS